MNPVLSPTVTLENLNVTDNDLQSDIHLFRLVDLSDPKSVDMYFPKQKGGGSLVPSSSITGCCKDFRVVFQAIRSWRELSLTKQHELSSLCEARSSNEQKNSRENTKYLSVEKNKELLISTALEQDPECPSPLPHNADLFQLGLFPAPQTSSIISNGPDQVSLDSSMIKNISMIAGRGIAKTITETSFVSPITSPQKQVTTINDSLETPMITKAVIDKMLVFMKYQAVYNDAIKHSNEFQLKHSVISLTTRSLPYSNIHGGKSTKTKCNSPQFCATGSNKVEIVSSMLLFLSNAIDELSPTEHTKLIRLIGEKSVIKVSQSLSDLVDKGEDDSDRSQCIDTNKDETSKSPIEWVVANDGLLKNRVETFKVNLLENRSKKSSSSDQLHKETDETKCEKKRASGDNHLLELVNKKPKLDPSFQDHASTVDSDSNENNNHE